jgi:hypothetical protein
MNVGVLSGAMLVVSCASAATLGRLPPASGTERDVSVKIPHAPPLAISLSRGTPAERETQHQLERLVSRYDLRPWLFTRTIVIDETAIPHSHPVLTLHTRHLRDDVLLLSTFIHEQSHRYLGEHPADLQATIVELQAIWPSLPVGFPEGADTLESSYEHLVVIALEHRGLVSLVGELLAQEVIAFWATDHYRSLYKVAWENRQKIGRIMRAHHLDSPG